MKGDAVDDGNEQERPVGAAFGLVDIAAVVDGEENVARLCEVRECFAERARVWGLKEHEGHAWTEKDDVGGFIIDEEFAFEIPI